MSTKFDGLSPELLNQTTNDIDTSMPRIATGLVECVIASAKVEPNNAGDKQNLNLQLKTLKASPATDGSNIGAGAVLFHTISLTPTEKYKAERIVAAVGQMAQACRVNTKVGLLLEKPEQLVGKNCIVKVGIQAETDDYPERNTIKRFEVKA